MLPTYFETGSHIGWELAKQTRLAGQRTPSICLSVFLVLELQDLCEPLQRGHWGMNSDPPGKRSKD